MNDSSNGQLGMEGILVLIVLVVVGIGFIMIAPMAKEINADLQAEVGFAPEAKSVAQSTVGDYPERMDNVYFLMFFLLWIFMIGAAFFSNTHPIFLAVSILLVVFILGMSMLLGDAYEELQDDPDFSEFTGSYPKMNWIMGNILKVFVMMTLSTLMVLYTRLNA